MTPYELAQREQERYEHQDAIAEAYYTTGMSDAFDRHFPRWTIEPYLSGYIAGIKQLPSDAAGRIQHDGVTMAALDDEF